HGTWGQVGETPNAIYAQVVALTDMPGVTLEDVWQEGEKLDLITDTTPTGYLGQSASQYIREGAHHLWFRFYDGTQTTADSILTSWFGSSPRPYGADRIGHGVPYVVVTALRNDLDKENPL